MGHVLWPLYDGKVGLSLLAGPANAGKVALLLERYLARLDDEPVLIVPNASDVDRVERDLLARHGCLFSGEIVTFDRLFELLVRDDPDRRPVATDHQRALIVRRAVGVATLNGLTASARTSGFADALQQTLGELESGLLDPSDLDGDLARLYEGYRGELDRLALWDLDLLRRRAAERLQSDLDAWHGEPVFAYGFECRSRSHTSPGARCSHRYSAPPTISRRSQPGASRSCRPARPSTRIRRSRTSSARSSASRHRLRRRSTAPCASSRAPARAARLS